jgi:2-dehydropantoate 2-reductase
MSPFRALCALASTNLAAVSSGAETSSQAAAGIDWWTKGGDERHSKSMNIGIIGAGAIGGWVAARLAAIGESVSILARGSTAGSLLTGLELVENGDSTVVRPSVSTSADVLGRQDLVIIAVKAPGLKEAAHAAEPMIGPATTILPMMNGVPWWFADGEPLRSVDPHGSIAEALPIDQVVGCVVHAACRRDGPARIVVAHADKLILGDPDGGAGKRVHQLCALFARAGIRPDPTNNIRRAIWYKLWGNATLNPLSALTLATADRLLAECKPFLLAGMAELAAVGAAIGCPIEESGEERMAVTARLGPFKTSMLQDVEAGRPIELEALLGAPIELARRANIPVPTLDSLFAMTRLMAESRGLA